MDFEVCIKTMQSFLENRPLIVLGSGASIPYGLPSMQDLATNIKNLDSLKTDPKFEDFCEEMDRVGLEAALDKAGLQSETLLQIRSEVWQQVKKCDLSHFQRNISDVAPEISALISKIIAPTPNKAVIVTTNYDRLAEYASDNISATTVTGFEGTHIRKLEIASSVLNSGRMRARERICEIWKVHGSLDWFSDENGGIYSIPFSDNIPNGFFPLIVPPGKDKYSSTHNEPFRSIIAEADKAFSRAGSFLCIGYGFNDEHIQPKLITQIISGKPIVVLARTMTDACRTRLLNSSVSKVLVFERADENKTKIHGKDWSAIFEGNYWQLNEFLKIW